MFSMKLYAVLAVAVVIGITLIADRQIVASFNDDVLADTDINLREIEAMLTNAYHEYRNDIHFLYTTPPIAGITRAANNSGVDPFDQTTTAQWQHRLTQIFMGFMENNREYFQLRVLDATGFETIRVERRNGKVFVTDANDLQDKSARSYFTQTKTLREGQLFVSAIDLNREYGEISFPYQPTLRLALPIFDRDNTFFGVIIANIDISILLEQMDVLVGDYLAIILTDNEHFFIKHPDKALMFSRDLAPDKTFLSEYSERPTITPGLQLYNLSSTNSQLHGAGRKIVMGSSESGGQLYAYVMVDDHYYQEQINSRRFISLSGLGAVMLLAFFALYMMGRNNNRLGKLLAVAEETKAAVDVAEEAIITASKEWHINTYNQAFERMFLLQQRDIVGYTIIELLERFGGDEVAAALRANVGTGISGIEWKMQVQSGHSRWFNCKVNNIDNPNTIACFAIIIRDITVEKESILQVAAANRHLEAQVQERTEALRRARDEALEVSQLKTNFIYTISHEMRTPLNGIVGATSLLRKERLDAKQSKLLFMAEHSVETLKRLIDDILDLSKIEAGKLEMSFRGFNPEALIEGVTSTMAVVAAQKGLGFYVDTSALHFSQINSDPHRLTQVLNNVINNAIKFTTDGYIWLTSWSEIEGGKATLAIEISDTGKGIAQDQVKKLFKAFSQADETIAENYGGSGLGLSICREILGLLGGTIEVESQEGEGAHFLIKIPLVNWQVKSAEDNQRLTDKHAGLIVNDCPLRAILQNLLVTSGAKPEAVHWPVTLSVIESMDYIFLERSTRHYREFVNSWRQWVTQSDKLPQLYVISKNTLSAEESLPLSLNLVEPIYRSTFLSNVINSRNGVVAKVGAAPPEVGRLSDTSLSATVEQSLLEGIKILIVDDNEVNRQIASFMLESHHPVILMAENGEDAISQLERNEDVRLVLMDCNMPVLNGYETTEAIRHGAAGEAYKDIPIIAMTANALKGEREKCYNVGMNKFITKPLNGADFIKKVKACITNNGMDASEQDTHDMSAAKIWQRQEALSRLGGNDSLLRKLLVLYLDESKGKLAALEHAIEMDDREELRFTAHALKGNAAEIGANVMKELLARLEFFAQTYTHDEMETLLEEIVLQNTKLVAMFTHHLEKEEV